MTAPPRRSRFALPALIGAGQGPEAADLRRCTIGTPAGGAAPVAQDGKVKISEIAATRQGTVARMRVMTGTDSALARPVAHQPCLPPV